MKANVTIEQRVSKLHLGERLQNYLRLPAPESESSHPTLQVRPMPALEVLIKHVLVENLELIKKGELERLLYKPIARFRKT